MLSVPDGLAAAYALTIPVLMTARARVTYDGHDYSMPPTALGQPATLHLYPDAIEIVTKTGGRVRQPRLRARGAVSILPEHCAAMLTTVRGARARLYFQRHNLWELGPAAETWLTELVHRRPAQWRTDVEQCFALLQSHGARRVLAAFTWGLDHQAIGGEYVKAQLTAPTARTA